MNQPYTRVFGQLEMGARRLFSWSGELSRYGLRRINLALVLHFCYETVITLRSLFHMDRGQIQRLPIGGIPPWNSRILWGR
jgi:hypothetical protein